MATIIQSITLPDGIDIQCTLSNGQAHTFHAPLGTVDLQAFADSAEADLLLVLGRATLAQAKESKLAQVDFDFDAQLEAGVNVGGVILSATVSAQNEFTKGLVALGLLRDLGQYSDGTAMSAFGLTPGDHDGNAHDMTALQYKQLCGAYLQAIGTLRAAYVARRAAVEAASTIDAVAAL